MRYLYLFALLLSVLACQEKEAATQADTIITNATIWTGNEQQVSAQAMAIAGDTILAIGTTETVDAFKGTTSKIVDAKGAFITPGFIDSHVDLMMGGRSLLNEIGRSHV